MKKGERNKTREEQVIHSTVAHHSLTSAQAAVSPSDNSPCLYTWHSVVWNFLLASLGQLSQPCCLPVFCAAPHWQSMSTVLGLGWAQLSNNQNTTLLSTLYSANSKTQHSASCREENLLYPRQNQGKLDLGCCSWVRSVGSALCVCWAEMERFGVQVHSSTVLLLALAGRCHCSAGWQGQTGANLCQPLPVSTALQPSYCTELSIPFSLCP